MVRCVVEVAMVLLLCQGTPANAVLQTHTGVGCQLPKLVDIKHELANAAELALRPQLARLIVVSFISILTFLVIWDCSNPMNVGDAS